MTEQELLIAKAIWAKRPDCIGKPWPLETEEQRRAYPHNPVAAADLCIEYAHAAIAAIGQEIAERDETITALYICNDEIGKERDEERERCAQIAESFDAPPFRTPKPTIAELEAILACTDRNVAVQINPDGSLRVGPSVAQNIARAIRAPVPCVEREE